VYTIELPFSTSKITIVQVINKKDERIISLKLLDDLLKPFKKLHERGELSKVDSIEIRYDNKKVKSRVHKKIEEKTIFWSYEYKVPVDIYLKIDSEYISLNEMNVVEFLIDAAKKNLKGKDLKDLLSI
ncbi:MAG: hypothetical protein J7L47_04560, partial [Candidatus Odinarchaeota archaeon]|nr:hypothetical protein [Candidatus Odinarchaeota archaeon]